MEPETYLAIYNLSAGLGIGILVIAVIGEILDFISKTEKYADASRLGAFVSLPCAIIALIAYFLHIGRPEKFSNILLYPTLTAVKSLEGITFILFLLPALIYVLLSSAKVARVPRLVIGLTAAVIGLSSVNCTGAVYLIPSRPAWNSPVVTEIFLVGALLLGTFTIGALLSLLYYTAKTSQRKTALLWPLGSLSLAGFILVIIQSVLGFMYLSYLSHYGSYGVAEALLAQQCITTGSLASQFWGAVILGAVIPFFTSGISVLVTKGKRYQKSVSTVPLLTLLGFICTLIGAALMNITFMTFAIPVAVL